MELVSFSAGGRGRSCTGVLRRVHTAVTVGQAGPPERRTSSSMRRTLLTTAAASLMAVGALAPASAESEAEGCHPTAGNLPVCPAGGAAETVSFLDPTARVVGGEHVSLGESGYVGPFAELVASEEAPISIGPESNVQDNVSIIGSRDLVGDPAEDPSVFGSSGEPAPRGPQAPAGVEVADRVIMAHGSSVIGPAQIGVQGSDIAADPDDDQEVFLSFGAQVDGAILEKNTGVSALGRVGPGVVLRSGTLVLPGKDVTTQASLMSRTSPSDRSSASAWVVTFLPGSTM